MADADMIRNSGWISFKDCISRNGKERGQKAGKRI